MKSIWILLPSGGADGSQFKAAEKSKGDTYLIVNLTLTFGIAKILNVWVARNWQNTKKNDLGMVYLFRLGLNIP